MCVKAQDPRRTKLTMNWKWETETREGEQRTENVERGKAKKSIEQ